MKNNANFWESLPRPFFVLAPMEDVTDIAFRRVIASHGTPDVFFTEFTSADGLVRADEKGQRKLRAKLRVTPGNTPTVVQLFSARPEYMREAAMIAVARGASGIDINMGCPDATVEKQGSGAALIKNPPLARALIRAAQSGVVEAGSTIPVSVKTRLGYHIDQLDEWLPELLAEAPAALTIHARTRKEMSKVPARWERVARAVALRDQYSPLTRIIGNGDVSSVADAREKVVTSGADGAMLGRAIYGNPWLFSERAPTTHERLEALREHIRIFDQELGSIVPFATMKKHFKSYTSGLDHSAALRDLLMHSEDASSACAVIDAYLRDAIL